MTKPAAFRATYSDVKVIKTRQCVQLVFEVPLAEFDAAYEIMGGLPDPAKERWAAIAPIKAESARQVKSTRTAGKLYWKDVPPAQQAGIRCEERVFAAFLFENHKDHYREAANDPAECVRLICSVQSRAELTNNQTARVIWHQLDEQFQAWKALEHA